MSGALRGAFAAASVEARKALAQWHYRLVLVACAAAPIAFTALVGAQGTVPSDTLFGRYADESGLAVPLVVLGFAGLWGLPVVAAEAGGDMFASEDRHRTWSTILARSRSRGEVFAGKTIVACAFASIAVALLGCAAAVAGALIVGTQPLVDLSGALIAASEALPRIALAWASVVPPCLAVTAAALCTSVATRSSVAGVGVPLVAALLLQLIGFIDLPAAVRVAVPTTAFDAWHGLIATPAFHAPIVYGSVVNLSCAAALIAIAWRCFLARDIA